VTLSTHVLDTGSGLPAAAIAVTADRYEGASWQHIVTARTDDDGRIGELVGAEQWCAGRWRLVFATGAYLGPDAFWPEVVVTFAVADAARHHHVPLLLSRYGYSTYRGS
jgi:5-hydroxyisourate hydrolase